MVRFARVLIACVFALAACTAAAPLEEEAIPTPFPTPIRPTYTVQRGDVIRQADFTGRVAPVVSRELFFAMDGRVAQVYVAPGDEVTAGQLLADLTALADLQAQWAQAVEAVQRQEEVARKVIRRAEIDLEIAQLTLDLYKSQGRTPFEVRIQELEVERAQMALDEVRADPALLAANDRVKQLETEMGEAQLIASVEGTVIAAVEAGQSVRTTTTAFVIGDIRQLEVSADVPDALLKELFEYMPVTVWLEGQPETPFNGAIRRLPYPYGSGSSENNDGSVRITLEVSPTQGGYALGDEARVTAVLGQKLNTLWLPPEAIRSAGNRTFVIVETDAGPRQVNITLGVQTRERVEVLEGLSEGQVVIGP
jgi:RND family efflux transporter MFP subunit